MHRAATHSVGRVLVWRSKGCLLEYIHWRSHCAVSLSETLYPPLIISIQPMKTSPDMTEKWLTGT